MATDKQLAAARANGAKSHGPTSPAGKARSSRNALKHGLSAGNSAALIAGEDEHLFLSLNDEFMRRFQPESDVEAELVREMVQAAWRLRRARSIENSLLEIEMLHTETKHPELQNIDFNSHLALAFKDLTDSSNSLTVLNRYCARLNREFHRALKTLRQLQAERAPQPDPTGDTEAKPRELVRVSPLARLELFLPNEPDFTPITPETTLATPPSEESEPPECI